MRTVFCTLQVCSEVLEFPGLGLTQTGVSVFCCSCADVVQEFEFLGTRGSSFRTDWLWCVIVNPTLNVIVFWNVYYRWISIFNGNPLSVQSHFHSLQSVFGYEFESHLLERNRFYHSHFESISVEDLE